MIDFKCENCGRAFLVPPAAAGRAARCKCGAKLIVPSNGAVMSAALPAAAIRGAAEAFAAPAPADSSAAVAPSPKTLATHGSEVPVAPALVAPALDASPLDASPLDAPALHAPALHAPALHAPAPAAPAPAPAAPAPAATSSSNDVAPPPTPITTAPAPDPSSAASKPARRVPVRTRRLIAEAQQMATAFVDSPLIRVSATRGDPPERYQIDYTVNSLERGKNGAPRPRQSHRVEIQLTSDYPRLSPKCRMLTPIFHPNIDPTTICVGDHWSAGERLVDLVVRIGEMLAYQAYNIKSPLDAEAAMWADLHPAQLPTDNRSLRPPGMD